MNRRFALILAVPAALAVLAAWWRVHEIRRAVLASLREPLYRVFENFRAEAQTLAIAGGAVLFLALVAGIAALVRARRQQGAAFNVASMIAPAAIVALAASAVIESALLFLRYVDPCGAPDDVDPLRYELFTSHGAPLQQARVVVLAALVLGSVMIVAFARRDRRPAAPVSKSALVACAALFGMGLVAFASTRGAAHDAQNPPPLWELKGRTPLGDEVARGLPPAAGCSPQRDAPLVVLRDGGWEIDGARLSDVAEVRHVLATKRELWHQVNPNKRFPGVVAAAIPAIASEEDMARVLKVAGEAGYREVDRLEQVAPRQWATRTLRDFSTGYGPRVCRVTLPVP